ncbi:l1 transposable element-related [Holotrichia oblita]|uniref:L1 transposable element-related n=1 Tax=Holotrichia oblita TaxID=644536 RepID=A0ACB9T3P8_HOLOL|nr:l1 transposable element-related [Holotrichia oblita]
MNLLAEEEADPSNGYRARSKAEQEELINRVIEKVLTNKTFLEKMLNAVHDALSSRDQKIKELEDRIELQEQYSRSNNLRIFGVPESQAEKVEDVIVKICSDKLNLNISTADIDCCHRLKGKEGTHRPIIVRFCQRSIRNDVYRAKNKLKGTKTVIREDLTKALKQYDNFIENALQMREDAIAREKQLIGQSSYFLNKSGSKWLTVGLSPAAGFVPIVQIKSVNACIFFTQEEWEEFCKTEGCSPNHQMEASSYRDIQIIRLKSRGQQIVLSTETYNNIYHLQELINQKISVLTSSDFVSFYNHVLKSCAKMDGDLYSNIITLLATHINSQNTMYMLEVLYITYNTVFLDFEIMNCC